MSSRVLFAMFAVLVGVGTAWAAGTAGERDSAFGADGVVTYDDVGIHTVTADDGYLGLASVAPAGGGFTQWVVYRFEEDGTRDTAFGGGDGETTPLFGADRDDDAKAVLEAPDGRIFVAGNVSTATVSGKGKRATVTYDRDMVVACFEADGDLDTSFGDGGIVVIDLSRADGALHLAARGSASDYALYLAGTTYVTVETSSDGGGGGGKGKKGGGGGTTTTTSGAIVLVNLDMDGDFDDSFDGDGILVDDVTAAIEGHPIDDTPYGLVVDGSNRPVVSVFQSPAGFVPDADTVIMTRYTSAGAPDMSFGEDGRMLADSVMGIDIDILALDADGESLLCARTGRADAETPAIARYDANGDLDTVFDLSDLASTDVLTGLAVQADGKVVAALWVGSADWDITVARYLANGNPDTGFGPTADGQGDWTDVDAEDESGSVFVRSDGKIVLTGRDGVTGDRILVRYLDL